MSNNSYDFLGAQDDFFMKSSWNVFTNLNGNLQFVGKTTNEKTISPNVETIEWMDNTSGTQTRFVLDLDRFDFSVSFGFMQVFDKNALALAMSGELDTSDANVDRVFFGSAPPALDEAQWRFTGQSRTGLGITLVIRKGVATFNGDWETGASGDYTNFSVTVSALQDTSITNTQRDMAYFELDRRSDS